jgi:SPP1 gp7 family putative phage head morphogenesis protein
MPVNLYYACSLPPAKAIAYFKSKGFAIGWNWQDVWQEAHAQAFTVAKVARMDILQDIRDAVNSAIDKGDSFATFRKSLEPILKDKGWWGKQWVMDDKGQAQKVQLGSVRRLRTIYDTNTQTAYQAGRWKSQMDNIQDRPYGEFVVVLDKRTSNVCRALSGLTYPLTDPIWDTHYPPIHWGCRTRVRTRAQEDVPADKVLSSDGALANSERVIDKATGRTAIVTTLTTPDGHKVTTDPGWNYNPGKAKWQPDLSKYDADIKALYDKDAK